MYIHPGIAGSGVNGSPIGFATVVVEAAESGEALSGTLAGQDGRFVIQGVAPGQYTIRTSFPGFRPTESDVLVSELNQSYDLGACVPERDLVGVFGFADRDVRAGVLPGSGGDWAFSGRTRRPGVGFGEHWGRGRRFRDGRGCAGGLSPGLRGARACAHAA